MITSIADIRTYVPTILANSDWNQYQQHVEFAVEMEILPVVGQALHTEINGSGVTGIKATLKTLSDRVTALYGFYYSLYHQLTAAGALGVHEQVSRDGSSSPVRQWVMKDQAEKVLLQADVWMEKLIRTLETNKNDLSSWESSDEYQLRQGLILHSADFMKRYVRLSQPLRMFRKLEPSIRAIEEFTIRPLIGTEAFDDLLEKQYAASPTVAENIILEKVRRAVCFLSVADALPQLSVIMDSSGLYVPSSADGITSKAAMSDNQFKKLIDDYASKGAQALADIVTYLEANPSSFPLYVPRGATSILEPLPTNATAKGSFFS